MTGSIFWEMSSDWSWNFLVRVVPRHERVQPVAADRRRGQGGRRHDGIEVGAVADLLPPQVVGRPAAHAAQARDLSAEVHAKVIVIARGEDAASLAMRTRMAWFLLPRGCAAIASAPRPVSTTSRYAKLWIRPPAAEHALHVPCRRSQMPSSEVIERTVAGRVAGVSPGCGRAECAHGADRKHQRLAQAGAGHLVGLAPCWSSRRGASAASEVRP